MAKLPKYKQDEIVDDLVVGMDTLEEEEHEELYEQLDREHKGQVDEAARRYAANAIGDEHWDSDEVG